MNIAADANSRRAFLAGAAAGVAAAVAPAAHAQAPATASRRIIDVHHHLTPPRYLSAIMDGGFHRSTRLVG